MEEWRDIEGYEGLYQVSSLGRIKSVKNGIKEQNIGNRGYLRVGLGKNAEQKTMLVHRLVAKAFIPNPAGLPQVNHKDENKTNNCVDNLEWCSSSYNINYGNRNKTIMKKVNQYTLDGEFIRSFESAVEAGKALGKAPTNISRCCRKRGLKTAYGFCGEYGE